MSTSAFNRYKTKLTECVGDDSSERSDGTSSLSRKAQQTPIDMSVLENLIDSEHWSGVEAFFKLHPDAVGARISNMSKRISSYASSGSFPLHVICSHRGRPPVSLINLLLELNEDAIKLPGEHGYLPLHCACASGATTEVISRLIEVYPAACRCRDEIGGALPLHLGARAGTPEEALMEVLCVYPEASFMRDHAGKTPLDYAMDLPEETRNPVLYVIETAPILVETAKCAAARVEKTYETRIRGMQEAHAEFVRQLEARQEEELRGFMEMEVQFHNELAEEKERNIALAEIALEMQVKEKKLTAELADAGTLVRIEREENQARSKANSSELKQILQGPLELDEGDENQPIAHLLMEFATKYEQSQLELVELRQQEGMVRHLNELLSSKDAEISNLKLKLSEQEDAKQLAAKQASRFKNLHDGAQHELNHSQEENKHLRKTIDTQQQQLQEANRIRHVQESRLGTIKNLISSLSYNVDTWSMDDDWDRRNMGGGTQSPSVSLEGIEQVREKELARRRVHPSKREASPDKSEGEKSMCETHGTAGTVSTKDSGGHDDEDLSALTPAHSPSRPRSDDAMKPLKK